MKVSRATSDEIDDFLKTHPMWTMDDNKLQRIFTFRTFREAFGFMTEAALVAERSNHHPDWGNVYNRVTVHLATHDAGGVTAKDFDLASKMEMIAARR
jgi:4a-hydroxytetrahydrobiopterin dehydratase